MSLILDASITFAWFHEDERTPAVVSVLDRVVESGAIVPSIWKLEVANGFQTAIRRGRIDPAFRDSALEKLTNLAIELDSETLAQAWSTTPRIADRHTLTIYDATYLELAERRRLPLATLDRALCHAATASGVETLGL